MSSLTCLYVVFIVRLYLNVLLINLRRLFADVGRVTSSKRMDFDGHPDQDVDPGILKRNFYYCAIVATARMLLITQAEVDDFL